MNKKISGFILKIVLIVLLVFPAAVFAAPMTTSSQFWILKVDKERFQDRTWYRRCQFTGDSNPVRVMVLKSSEEGKSSDFVAQNLYIDSNVLIPGDIILAKGDTIGDECGANLLNPQFILPISYLFILPLIIFLIIFLTIVKRKKLISYFKKNK